MSINSTLLTDENLQLNGLLDGYENNAIPRNIFYGSTPDMNRAVVNPGDIGFNLTDLNLYIATIDSSDSSIGKFNTTGIIPEVILSSKFQSIGFNATDNTNINERHYTISAKLFKETVDKLPEVLNSLTSYPNPLPLGKTEFHYVPSMSLIKTLDNDNIKKSKNIINNLNGIPVDGDGNPLGSANDYVLSADLGPFIRNAIANAGGIDVITSFDGSPKDINGNYESGKSEANYALSADKGKELNDKINSLKAEVDALKVQIGAIGVDTSFETRIAALEAQNLEPRIKRLENIKVINGGTIE